MSLFDPFVFTVTGSPVGPTPPPELRVIGGQATPTQLQMAQQAFVQFCSRTRLSVVPNPREAGRLPDGSRFEIVVVGKAKTMLLWPVGGGVAGGPFIAWTAFFNSAHLPIWERPVVDFPYDDLPPKPEPPGPEPAYPPLAEAYSVAIGTGLPVTFPVGYHHVVKLYIGWGLPTDEPTLVVEGSWIITEIGRVTNESGSYGYYQHVRNNYYSGGDFYESVTVRNLNGGSVDYSNTDIDGSNSTPVTPTLTSVVGLYEAAAAAAAAYNAGAISAWEAAHAAWVEESLTYADRLADWIAERDALLALQRPWWPVMDIRKAARPGQVQNVKAHLLTGIGDRHLTARILSFPYNVAYRTEPPVGSGGSVTHEWVVEATQRGYRSTLTNAQPHTIFPIFDSPSADLYPAHILRRDFMPPECLFGWTANGQFSHVERYYAAQITSENFLVAPPGLGGVSVTYSPGYFTSTRLVPDSAPGLVVASDAFVPIGAQITVVVFEYLIQDWRTGEYEWVTCPDIMVRDSIWIRDGGVYIDTPLVRDNVATERVQIAGAYTQRRTAWDTWSAPKAITSLVQANWTANFVSPVVSSEPSRAPSAVVIAEGLPGAANPAQVQSDDHYLGAAHLWSGGRSKLGTAKAARWVPDGALAPQEQFIIRALIALGKIKP